VKYYGGIVEGVSAIFSASKSVNGVEINHIFGEKDIPDYQTYEFSVCPLCAKKQKIDAIVNSYGYSKL
jgi:orotate phosphoribosyltransferase